MGLFSRLGAALGGLLSPRGERPNSLDYIQPPEVQEDNGSPDKKAIVLSPTFAVFTDWTSQEILDALEDHERGNFSDSGKLWDWMGRDDRLATELGKREKGVTSLPFTACPSNRDDETSTPAQQDAAATLKEQWFKSFPEALISSIIRCAVGMGFALCQVTWEARRGSDGKLLWWPCLELWHPSWVYYDDFLKQWRVATREGFKYINPGDGQWFLYMPSGARGWMAGAVRSLAFPCFITSFDWRDWADFNDSVGHPVKVAYIARGTKKEDKDTFLKNLGILGRKTSVLLCQRNNDDSGYDFSFKEPGRIATDTFKESIETSSKAKTLVILGQLLTTDAAGSGISGGGPAEVHKLILAILLKSDAETLSSALREQIVAWWAWWNLGDSELAPWPTWDCTPPEDKLARATSLQTVAQAVALANPLLKLQGKVINFETTVEDLGFTLIEVSELVEQPTPPAPPPGGGLPGENKPAEDPNQPGGSTDGGSAESDKEQFTPAEEEKLKEEEAAAAAT